MPKIRIWTFGLLVHQINSIKELLKLKKNSKKIKYLLAKLHSLWRVHFVVVILFVLTLTSDRAVFNGHDVFSILLVSTKLWFLRKSLSFSRKFVSNLKYWKRLKLPLTVTWNMPISQTESYFEKSLVPFFRRIYAYSVGFKMKTLKKTQTLKAY